jgi:hypothetical protein
MTNLSARSPERAHYELRFQSLFNEGRGLTFPCDARGGVDLEALSERARNNFFFARAVVGREFALPVVLAATLQ